MSEHHSERVIEGEGRPEWSRPPAVAVVIVGFLLAAIVGMTSAASPWVAGDGSRSFSSPVVGEVIAVAVAAGLCILLALMWIRVPRRPRKTNKPGLPAGATDGLGSRLSAGALVLVAGTLVLVALVIAFWFLLGNADDGHTPPVAETANRAATLPKPTPAPHASAAFDWFFVGLLASIAIVVPLAIIARRTLGVTDDSEQDATDVEESVVRAVGESIDQIERDPDARRAIIRAYAQMEHAFDDAGVPRRPYEAPFEYLGRALRGVRVSPPAAARLASLFERARFSQQAVDAETKDDAIGALREIEREIRAAPP